MLTEFDDLWESIPLQERARLIELLIERVDYDGAAGKIKITFHPTGIASIGDASRRCAGHATACRKQRRIDFSDDLFDRLGAPLFGPFSGNDLLQLAMDRNQVSVGRFCI